MKNMPKIKSKLLHKLCIAGSVLMVACEAPLNLTQVDKELERPLRRYDMFQAAAHHKNRVVVVSSTGAVVMSDNSGASWQRAELPHRPSLIDVTACPNGDFYALDSHRQVWHAPQASWQWSASTLDTGESTLSIYCAPDNRLWLTASFGTLFSRATPSDDWQEFSLGEDLQFTAVRFVDELQGFAVGEFGTVVATSDGGKSWQHREMIPNDFYPMAADFADASRGWIGGLDGVVWQTLDGAKSWQRQQTPSSTPVYNIQVDGERVLAAGGSAKLAVYDDFQWRNYEGAPEVLTFLRALEPLASGDLLVAGGGGTLAVINSE